MSESLISDCWMTTAQVAAYTQRAEDTVLRAAGEERLKSEAGGRGRGRRYRRQWVDEWVEGKTRRTRARKASAA